MTAFLQNPRILAVSVGLVIAAGLSAFATIVRQEDPTITNRVALIITGYPGASAERVESLVTEKLEEELQQIRELQQIESTSRAGVSVVSIEINESIIGDATAPILSKVRDAVDDAKAEFPDGVLEPIFDDERFGSYSLIYGLSWKREGSPPMAIVQRYAEELEDRLRGVPGTDHVRVFGAAEEQIRVVIDPERLAAAGLSSQVVARALAAADAKGAAGVLRVDAQNILFEVEGELDTLDRVRRVPLAVDGSGASLAVEDVATVERGLAQPPREMARVDGRPGVLVATMLAPGQRFDVWRERVVPKAAAFAESLPEGFELELVFDQTSYTSARLSGLGKNLLTGLALVVGVLVLTLGWRPALIVTTALPLVSLASIAVLRFMNVPIHQMSVTGLIVALGLLVDNAIVMTDAVRFRRSQGASGPEAVMSATRHLAVPLFASTLTTVLAFMPILLLPGSVGEFVGTIGLSVIVALLASYALAIIVVAPLAGRFVSERSTGPQLPGLGRAFAASLDWSVRHPWRSMGLASTVPLLGFLGATTLTSQFFPPADRDQFHIQLFMPSSASIEATARAAEKVERILWARSEIRSVSWTYGRSAPPFYYNMVQNQDGNPAFGQALVGVRSIADVKAIFPSLQAELDRKVPEAQIILRELLQGPPVEAPVEYRIYGSELSELRRLGAELRERMTRAGVINHSVASLTASSPKLRVQADEVGSLLAGLRLRDVAGQLQLTMEGTEGGSVLEANQEVPVRVLAEMPFRRDLGRVQGLPLQGHGVTPERGLAPGVPLAALGDIDLIPAVDGIPRRNGERVNVVQGYIDAGVYPETAFLAVEKVLAEDPVPMPAGYRLEVGGDAEERADAMGDLFASVPVLVLLMVSAVALSLNSFRLAGVVFVIAFQSMGFGLLSLTLLRHPLGFQAIIGVIGLIGVAINASIVISSALRVDPEAVRGNPSRVSHVVLTETSRHIISTTITTFGGFLPLILTEGGFWPPFASAIAGGVVFSTIGSFYFVPAAFLVLTRQRPLGPVSAEQESEDLAV